MPDPTQKPDLEQRALNQLNAGESWFKSNRAWLLALAVTAAIAFVVGHLV